MPHYDENLFGRGGENQVFMPGTVAEFHEDHCQLL